MTRDEAVTTLFVKGVKGDSIDHGNLVDGLSALGLLKLEELKPVEQRMAEFFVDIDAGETPWPAINAALKKHSLKLVVA